MRAGRDEPARRHGGGAEDGHDWRSGRTAGSAGIRVAILADVRFYRDGIAQILSAHDDMTVVAALPATRAAVREVVDLAPDVALVDLRERGQPGSGRPLDVYEEEVPRSGARITRLWALGRAADGSTHLWRKRRKGPGRGEGSSGLRFDTAERRPQD